jgi:hypothetical protein
MPLRLRAGAAKNSRTHPVSIKGDAHYVAMNAECRIYFSGIFDDRSGLI